MRTNSNETRPAVVGLCVLALFCFLNPLFWKCLLAMWVVTLYVLGAATVAAFVAVDFILFGLLCYGVYRHMFPERPRRVPVVATPWVPVLVADAAVAEQKTADAVEQEAADFLLDTEPETVFARFPLPLLGYKVLPETVSAVEQVALAVAAQEVAVPVAVCEPVAVGPLYVATPKKDRRRPGGSVKYGPYQPGQKLKDGQYLAVKEGAKYRPATEDETKAA